MIVYIKKKFKMRYSWYTLLKYVLYHDSLYNIAFYNNFDIRLKLNKKQLVGYNTMYVNMFIRDHTE